MNTAGNKQQVQVHVNLDMEKAVIAGLLTNPDAIFDVMGHLKPEMFYHPGLRFVYASALSLVENGKVVDMLTIEQEMIRLDLLQYERLNGLSFISDMLLDVRTDHHIRYHADELVNNYLLRRMLDELKKKETEVVQASADVTSLLNGLDNLVDSLRSEQVHASTSEEAGKVAARVLEQSYAEQAGREAGRNTHIRTGFRELDQLTGGLYNGELVVIPARPSMGKSAVALWMALNAARAGKAVAFFSVEMSKEQLVMRLLSMLSGVDTDRLRFKGTTVAERERLAKAQEALEQLPLILEYCGSDTVEDMRAKAQALHKQGKLELLFIDYLNLINLIVSKNNLQETTDLALGNVVRKIKLMAEEMNIPVVLLAQMNRENERRPAPHLPVLSDLRNSGAIEQIADVVVFVYRAEKYNIFYDPKTKEDLRGVGLLLVAKNRNGATGAAKFRYNPAMTCLTDYDPQVI